MFSKYLNLFLTNERNQTMRSPKKFTLTFFFITLTFVSFYSIQATPIFLFSNTDIDYNHNSTIALDDAIIALQLLATMDCIQNNHVKKALSNNQSDKLENVITILQILSGNKVSEKTIAAVISIKENSGASQYQVPVSVVCSFDPGDVLPENTLYAFSVSNRLRTTDTEIPVQMNHITTYDDGSIQNAEITFMLPYIDSNEQQTLELITSDQINDDPPVTLEDVLNSGFYSRIELVQNDKILTASFLNLLQNHSVHEIFAGPVCSKWEISGPFVASDGSVQQIIARFQISAYKGCDRIRVDACVNNQHTPIPGQYSFYYDLTMTVGDMVYIRKNMPLPPLTNWTKIMWWGQQPLIDIVNGGLDPFVEKNIVQTIITNTSDESVSNIPVTFGHVFKKGDISPDHILNATLDDGSHPAVQLDKKVNFKDGSLRHGIISMILPAIPVNSSKTISLSVRYADSRESDTTISLSDLIQSTYNTIVTVHIGDKEYQAQAKTLLQNSQPFIWLSGSVTKEWHFSAPLQSTNNEPHPHLTAHFYIRAYANSPWVKTSVIIENNWTYVDSPQNITYNISIATDSQIVYQQNELIHYTHARWRKVFWQDVKAATILDHQPIHIVHDINYLMATKVIPNFDPDLIGNIPEKELNKTYTDWMARNAPMSAGLINNYSYGYDMWPVLKWTGQYLLSMDERVKKVMIGNAECAGSFPLHFRDITTKLPVSIDDYPYCTTHWTDTINPETGLSEAPAKCPEGSDCDTPHLIDPGRKPAYTFIPYLITGDYYFLEELHFWTNYCFLNEIPSNRNHSKGIIKGDLGDMAYSIRTIGQAAFITPEDHPLKSYFTTKLLNNINDYHLTYLENQQNTIGSATINNTKSIVLKDDYFTWALGYLLDLDFTSVYPLVAWKTSFPVLRMTSDNDFCWIFASNPNLQVADANTNTPFQSMKDVYHHSKIAGFLDDGSFECNSQELADYLKKNGDIYFGQIGEMIGKPWASAQPAMMQPALAVAVDNDAINAHAAWDRYMERSVIPDYASSAYPNYNIVPRRYQFDWEDSDQDGIINGLDECPETPQNTSVNRIGCPTKDSDHDGIFDYFDACPDSPTKVAVNAIGCHDQQDNPVLDSDGDGVCDSVDQCPSTPKDTTVDSFGCPLTKTGRIFEVGPNMPYDSLISCPTDALMSGDEIHVYYKETPYSDKFLVKGEGTIDDPIKIVGIPDASGKKPVLDGANGIGSSDYVTTNADRQVIKIGQEDHAASYIIIDGFEIRNANNTNTFINSSGNNQAYHDNACAIRVENGSHITIRDCIIHHNGNGIQTGKETHHVLIESCQIYQNGVCQWQNSYIHNMYLSGHNGNTIIVQYCYIGELLSQGQQVKSRAEKFIFRYNWLEGGRNAQIDMVEDYEISDKIPYDAYVYGNIIIKPDLSDNSVMIHFGGDQPDTNRMGTLRFYNNTCIIKDTKTSGSRRIFKISSENATVAASNNIFYLATPTTYELLSGSLNLSGKHNWLSQSITTVDHFENSIISELPYFVDPENDNYHLQADSPCKDAALTDIYPENLEPVYQYQKDADYVERSVVGDAPDLGAFEQGGLSPVETDKDNDGIFDNDDLCPGTISGMIVDDIGCSVKMPEEHVFLSFDSDTGNINDGFDNWDYRSPEKDPVYKMTEVGGFYSSSDSQGFHKAFFPYKNISNTRLLRYGYIDINTQIPAHGTGCLKFVFTGGAYLNNDIIAYSGLELFYKSQFDAYINLGQSPYASLPLVADEQFYVKFADSKTRPFDEAQGADRLSVWIYLPKCSHENSPFPIRTIQYYPYIDTSVADHYYHWLTNIGMGGWTHILIDAHPQRNNTGSPVDENGNPLPYEYYRAGGHDYPGNAVEYFNQTVAFAIRLQLGDYSFPTPVYLDHFTFYKSNQAENDETISNIGLGYNPDTHEFDIGFCDKYRGNGCHATYEVRYSFRPITNASYPKTKLCTVIQAPNLDFTYTTDVKGQIKKPVTGYNQLWGLIKLELEDEQKLKHGTKVYFAVKDVSNRTYPDRDPYDEEKVEAANIGQMRRIDLIKTISYDIIDLPNLERSDHN